MNKVRRQLAPNCSARVVLIQECDFGEAQHFIFEDAHHSTCRRDAIEARNSDGAVSAILAELSRTSKDMATHTIAVMKGNADVGRRKRS